MTVRGVTTAADLLGLDARSSTVRLVMDLPPAEVVDLAAAAVAGDPLAQLASATLGEDYVDRVTAAQVLGVDFPESPRRLTAGAPLVVAEGDPLVELAAAVLGDRYVDSRGVAVLPRARLAR